MKLLFDCLLLLILMAYIVSGVDEVPFHGDESTIVWMSKDYDSVVLRGHSVAYEPPPRRTSEQHLRILNGSFSRWV